MLLRVKSGVWLGSERMAALSVVLTFTEAGLVMFSACLVGRCQY